MIPFGYFYFAFWTRQGQDLAKRFTFRDFPELSMPNEWENTKQALFLLILLFSQLVKL